MRQHCHVRQHGHHDSRRADENPKFNDCGHFCPFSKRISACKIVLRFASTSIASVKASYSFCRSIADMLSMQAPVCPKSRLQPFRDPPGNSIVAMHFIRQCLSKLELWCKQNQATGHQTIDHPTLSVLQASSCQVSCQCAGCHPATLACGPSPRPFLPCMSRARYRLLAKSRPCALSTGGIQPARWSPRHECHGAIPARAEFARKCQRPLRFSDHDKFVVPLTQMSWCLAGAHGGPVSVHQWKSGLSRGSGVGGPIPRTRARVSNFLPLPGVPPLKPFQRLSATWLEPNGLPHLGPQANSPIILPICVCHSCHPCVASVKMPMIPPHWGCSLQIPMQPLGRCC